MLHLFDVQTYMTQTTEKIQYKQNEALRISIGCHKMSRVHHLHVETEILKVREHSDNRKATLQPIHTDAVNKAVNDQKKNIVLDDLPRPINDSEKYLTRKERAPLAQIRSEYCRLLGSYKSRKKEGR